jgi:membrane protein
MATVGQHKLRLGELGKCLITAAERFTEDDMMTYAAAIAYQMFFSLFSLVIFLISLLGILQISGFFDQLLDQAQTALPGQAAWIVEQVIGQVRELSGIGVLSFGVIATLWSASTGVRALMHALNAAYHVEQPRPTWKRFPLSIFYAVLLMVMIIVPLGLILISSQEVSWIADQLGVSTVFATLWSWLRFPVAVLFLMVVIAFVYYLLPNADEPFRFVTPGAVLAVIAWVAASLVFSYYVSNFVVYNATYGSLGAVLALLLYFFITASVLLFGAEVNVAIYHKFAKDEKEGEKARETS